LPLLRAARARRKLFGRAAAAGGGGGMVSRSATAAAAAHTACVFCGAAAARVPAAWLAPAFQSDVVDAGDDAALDDLAYSVRHHTFIHIHTFTHFHTFSARPLS
jgi:hypothetical protein